MSSEYKTNSLYDGVSFKDTFDLQEVIGKGAFSTVRKCCLIQGPDKGKEFACKMVKAKQLSSRDKYKLDKEIKLCRKLIHVNIVSLHYVYQDESYCYMVFDLITGGELFDDIVKREYYSESEASSCMNYLLQAIEFCHDRSIVHRDLKPENLLLSEKSSNSKIKVADFGLAVEMDQELDVAWYGFAGTPGYLSPEILKREPYGRPTDLWACGVILYILLVGYPPFWDEDQQKLYAAIRQADYEFPSPEWDGVTQDAKNLVRQLLNPNQERRLTAKQSLNHPWIAKPETASKIHRQDTISGLKSFNARMKLKGAVLSTMLTNKLIRGLGSYNTDTTNPTPVTLEKDNIPPIISEEPELDVATDDTAPSDSSKDLKLKVIELTGLLLTSINKHDWETYKSLCSTQLTCYEPETSGHLVTGLDFHKYYFDHSPINTNSYVASIVEPNVSLFDDNGACISYKRQVDSNLFFNETRIWTCSNNNEWNCIHFHRS